MKNREKFLVIFAVVLLLVLVSFMITEQMRINNEINKYPIYKELSDNGYTEKVMERVDEIENEIKNTQATDITIGSYAMSVFILEWYNTIGMDITNTAYIIESITGLLKVSLYITTIVYAVITIKYKNIKQYLLDLTKIFLILIILFFGIQIFDMILEIIGEYWIGFDWDNFRYMLIEIIKIYIGIVVINLILNIKSIIKIKKQKAK